MTVDEPAGTRRGGRHGATQRLAGVHPAGMIHGALVMAATLALMGGDASSDASLLGAVGVLVVYWLTHAYTHALADGIDGDRLHLVHRLVRSARHEVPILIGGLPALIVFVAALLLGAEPQRAMRAGLWLTVALMAIYGYLAAHQARVPGWRSVAEAAFAALLGLFMVALNTLLH